MKHGNRKQAGLRRDGRPFRCELRVAGIGTVPPARDAAIHKCVNEAQARYPNVGEETTMRARTDVYRSCMQAAGQNP